jgi:L-threonylcarbamoyladenylate synthase
MAAALESGSLGLLPTDTVYGLVCVASNRSAALQLYRLKGRAEAQPTAVIAVTTDLLLETIPGLGGFAAEAVRALLPGPFTLIVPDREQRFGWLSGGRPGTIGVRVPELDGIAAGIVAEVGMVAATSANLPGDPDPLRLDDVPAEIRRGVAFAVDGGELPGIPSTVIDLTGEAPAVLRVGAGDPDVALARLATVFTESLRHDDATLTRGE